MIFDWGEVGEVGLGAGLFTSYDFPGSPNHRFTGKYITLTLLYRKQKWTTPRYSNVLQHFTPKERKHQKERAKVENKYYSHTLNCSAEVLATKT